MPWVTTNGVETYYERTGSGPPVVFVHGLSWDHRSWRPQMERLESYDTVAYDYRGHGNTELSTDGSLTIEALADDLHALVTELGLEQPVLCVHSYGGLIASEYAIKYPEDVGGIAFVDARTRMGESTFERVTFRLRPVFSRIQDVVGRDRFQRAMQFVAERVTDMEAGPDEEVPELGCTVSEYVEDAQEAFGADEEEQFTAAGQAYVGASATDFHVPVLYAYGEGTAGVIADKAERLERAPTDVRVREIENAGHGLTLEQPEAFTAVLEEFLDSIDERPSEDDTD